MPVVFVVPPSSAGTTETGVWLAALNAVTKSFCACITVASLICCVPFKVPGGNPVIEVLGLNPMSPLITLDPVLVMVEPARMAKLVADKRFTGVGTAAKRDNPVKLIVEERASPSTRERFVNFFMQMSVSMVN